MNIWSLHRNYSVVFCCERFKTVLLPQDSTESGTLKPYENLLVVVHRSACAVSSKWLIVPMTIRCSVLHKTFCQWCWLVHVKYRLLFVYLLYFVNLFGLVVHSFCLWSVHMEPKEFIGKEMAFILTLQKETQVAWVWTRKCKATMKCAISAVCGLHTA